MPDLPTIDESGVPNFELTFWQAASLPKNTPIAIVQEWEAAIKKVLKDQEVQTRFREQGYEARGSTSDQLADFMQREAAKWAKVIADANIHIDH